LHPQQLTNFLFFYSKDPENDPETAQNCVDLIYRLVHRYMHVMVQFQPPSTFQNALVFSLRCLAGFDILPKRAAAQLWVLSALPVSPPFFFFPSNLLLFLFFLKR
jgi:hypothetical protein